MKPITKLSLTVIILGVGVALGSIFDITAQGAGVTGQAGTADDPVVTKSYVDQQIQKALGGGATTPTNPTAPTDSGNNNSGNNNSSSSSDQVTIVTVKPGEKLIAAAGAEFIVRNGHAVIYSADSNGVADLTDGKDVTNGQAVGNNHLMSFPRAGRGIMVQDGVKSSLTVMVRGGYSIQ
ncbi:hypothetical protein BK138_28335 [Paenibacillus rhizosphaerae]|uniref:Uncharacterized protein n=1 Tax=Paenibacillus rhizosphaerae TaxID=297318 RepID=A0A1R1EED4_9BACL|nr:hypothetical protein [Paenibacillus rhizosphaerae]OMF50195.1 hypothetical protein BK138_28335 [Paenibacillus rhizosphaerae]